MPLGKRQHYFLRSSLGLTWLIILLLHVAGAWPIENIERLEIWSYDWRLRALPEPHPDPDVVIIDIDEESLAAVGRWPWPRDRMVDLIDELLDRQGAALVAFDIVFAEPDTSSGLPVLEALAADELRAETTFLERLEHLRPFLDRDARFADSLQGRPIILGYYFTAGDRERRFGQIPGPVFLAEDFGDRPVALFAADGYGANLPQLQQAAMGAGHFTPLFDADGLSRRVPLLIDLDGDIYEALSLAAARSFLGGMWPRLVFGSAEQSGYQAIDWLRLGERSIPLGELGTALIPYAGPQGSFPYLSAQDLLAGRYPPDSLRGRIALVGTSAPGLMDLRATPVGSAYPGVEIHANLIQGMIDQTIRHRPAYMLGFEWVSLLLAGLLLLVLLPRLGPALGLLLSLSMVFLVVGLALYFWHFEWVVMPMAAMLLAITGIHVLDTIYALFVESRAKARIAGLFGQYVPPRVVEALADNPELASMAGESREMTVLFSDVRNFTTISEGLSARDLAELMNDYLSAMTRALQENAGTVDKYIGDAIMAFWGAPLPDRQHATGAVRAALAMQQDAAGLRKNYQTRGWPPLYLGIGINTGMMNVGNMGSEFRRAYTVLGDSVNLASRLESLTKPYGVGVLVSEFTVAATGERFFYREIDRIQVKGKDKAIAIFEPLAEREHPDAPLPEAWADRVAVFARMLQAYRASLWDDADASLQRLLELGESATLVALFQARIAQFREQAPAPDWNGVFRFTTK